MKFLSIVIFLSFLGCSVSDYQTIMQAAISKGPSRVLQSYIYRKRDYYITHPKALIKDIKAFVKHFNLEVKKFKKAIIIWKNPKFPHQKTFVKYTQNYKARAIINFEKGK